MRQALAAALAAIALAACGAQAPQSATAPTESATAAASPTPAPFDFTMTVSYFNSSDPKDTGCAHDCPFPLGNVVPCFRITVVQNEPGVATAALVLHGAPSSALPNYSASIPWSPTQKLPDGTWGEVATAATGYARIWTLTLTLNGQSATHTVTVNGR